jgi:putative heme-binding domain-containing protein
LTSSFAEEQEDSFLILFAALHGFGEFPSDDPWCRRALALTLRNKAPVFLGVLLSGSSKEKPKLFNDHDLLLAAELAALTKPDKAADLSHVLRSLEDPPRTAAEERLYFTVVHAMARASSRANSSLFSAIEKHPDGELRRRTLALFDRAASTALDARAPLTNRHAAVELLSYVPTGTDALSRLALADSTQVIRTAAIAALARGPLVEPWKKLLTIYAGQSPAVRRAIADGAIVLPDRAFLLLDELSAGRIKPSELDRTHVDRLLKHSDPKIRERAAKLLADAIPADRQKVLADYQVVLKMAGDAKRGIESFKKNCAACHRIGDVGVNVAPDISDSRVKTAAQILTDILQPNRAIDANYVSYSVLTADGRQLTGIIAAETATSVTLRQQEGKSVTLLRTEIEKMQSNGVSLMPEGLEKTIPPQEMADLVAFIKHWRYLDGRTPLAKQ